MTSVGKFALLSQSERNPSIISFFIALTNTDEGMDIEEFEQLWSEVMKKHDRFRFRVREDGKCFEEAHKSIREYTSEVPHPQNPIEFKARINSFLTCPMDVKKQGWEVSLSSGPIGASGAILDSEELMQQGYKSETVALFRVHHVLCDGLSLSAAVKDAADEKDQLDKTMVDALDKYKKNSKKVGMVLRLVGLVVYYVFGSMFAASHQLRNMLTSTNPFDVFIKDAGEEDNERSLSWKCLTTVDDAKSVTRSVSKQIKLNDLFVALLSSALERRYQELKDDDSYASKSTYSGKCPSYVNVVVPVHLTGSILPGQPIGNKIGAFVSSIPIFQESQKKRSVSISRLRKVSKILSLHKLSTAPQMSWFITALISKLGFESIAKDAIMRFNCKAVGIVSNVHGFPYEIHWKGRPIKMLGAFLPLPPNVPIGIVATSYDGNIILVVEADKRVVPDADRFLEYMLEEYQVIKEQMSMQ